MLYYDIAEPTLVSICLLELTYNIGLYHASAMQQLTIVCNITYLDKTITSIINEDTRYVIAVPTSQEVVQINYQIDSSIL
jgi:hypothetical protein